MTPAERAQVIEDAAGPTLRALIAQAALLARTPAHYPDKAARFVDLAEAIGQAITPHTPCTRGCSHCCHMATAVSGFEAAMIGRYTGRIPVAQHRNGIIDGTARQDQLVARFTGVACTFLEAGRCTIYAVRPIACRVHHSANDDETDCRIVPGAPPVKVPRINLTAFVLAQALAFLPDDYGDIREFFPAVNLWTVYQYPEDYPGKFVARRWEVDAAGARGTQDVIVADSLAAVRARLPFGLARMERNAQDDPVILETWI